MKRSFLLLVGTMLAAAVPRGGYASETRPLVDEGLVRAQIVIADEPVNAVRYGAQELQAHLRAMTGAELPIVGWGARDAAAYPVYLGVSPGTADYEVAALGRQEYVVDVSSARTILLGTDDPSRENVSVAYTNGVVIASVKGRQPSRWDAHGSLNAVYDFLHSLGVRWLDASDAGTVLPARKTLTVPCGVRKVQPFVFCRDTDANPQPWIKTGRNPALAVGLEAYRTNAFAYAFSRKGGCVALMDRQTDGWLLRVRAGGDRGEANHSFYWFYDRFYETKNKAFVAPHPDWFARYRSRKAAATVQDAADAGNIFSAYDTSRQPEQMCYSSDGFVGQLLTDIRAYLDNGGYTNRYAGRVGRPFPKWGRDTYCLEPMDNAAFCECPDCLRQYEPARKAERSQHSTYWFGFVNRIAREIRKTHPKAKISTLAYMTHEGLPTGFRLEDNVVVHFCWSGNRMPNATKLNAKQTGLMRAWRQAYPDMPMGLWLYNGFPHESSCWFKYYSFPGYFSKVFEQEFHFIRDLNIRTCVFNCGMRDWFESYCCNRWLWNPSEPLKALKDDFFASYGPAEKPLRAFYDLVEDRFCSTNAWGGYQGHMTKPIAWCCLGNGETMERLAAYMDEAERAPGLTPTQRRRVTIWRTGVWDWMRRGRADRVELPSSREGVSIVRTAWLGGPADAFGPSALEGRPFEVSTADGRGVVNYYNPTLKGALAYQPTTDQLTLSDRRLAAGYCVCGKGCSNVLMKCKATVDGLSRVRLTLALGDSLRSRMDVSLVGWADGKEIELYPSFLVRERFSCEAPKGCTAGVATYDFDFAEGIVPVHLDAIGLVDRTFSRGWYSPRILKVEAAGRAREGLVTLATNGCACARIVLSEKSTKVARFAAQELRWHLKGITGADFEVVSDAEPPRGFEIRLGPTSRTKARAADFRKQQWLVDVSSEAIELFGLDDPDEGKFSLKYTDTCGIQGSPDGWPNIFLAQGTLYALYDFLENDLGVEWFDPTDVGTVLPKRPTLALKPFSRRGEPFIRCRSTTHTDRVGHYNRCTTLWRPRDKFGDGYERYHALGYAGRKPQRDWERTPQSQLFLLRHRIGGDRGEANHAFYDWYGRYWDKTSKNFREFRPDLFAKGYGDAKPPQLCYSNPEVLRLVVREVREYLDHGGFPVVNKKGEITGYDPHWGENSYSLEPMDNSAMCQCDDCRAQAEPQRPNEERYSTYWFAFVNKVAKEIKASHPTAKIRTLAYMTHKGLPTNLRLEDNVVIYFCLDSNRTSAVWTEGPVAETPDFRRMSAWRAAYPEQPLAFWLYNCFPNETADGSGFHCVPGFFAHKAVEEFAFFKAINAREAVYQCGINGDLDAWLQLELMVDPKASADAYLTRYFSQFGKAGAALRRFYETVESRYCSSCRPKGTGVSLRGDWGHVCPPEVMDGLEKIVDEARAAAAVENETVRKRVELYLVSNWEYMLPGSRQFVERTSTPTPSWSARRVAPAKGDLGCVDWKSVPEQATPLYAKSSARVSETTASVRFAHDGEWLYFELKLAGFDASKLYSKPLINPYDCWEIVVSRQMSRPYRYYVCGPDGRAKAVSFGEVNFRNGVPAEESGAPLYGGVYKAEVGKDSWTARWAMPLDKMLDRPVRPGETVYFSPVACLNRTVCGTGSTDNFDITSLVSFSTVHTTDRMAAVTLER